MNLRVHHFLPSSFANGPGCRSVLWLQGCPLHCPGCFNPQTHPPDRGELVSTDDLFRQIAAIENTVQGITISGGEPLMQRPALIELLQRVKRETVLSAILLTGFSWEEILKMADAAPLLRTVDLVVAGRYVAALRVASGLQGSANKTFHFLSDRYSPSDFAAVPEAEIIVEPGGSLIRTGINPLRLENPIRHNC